MKLANFLCALKNRFATKVHAKERGRYRPNLELLEDRMAPAVFTVTNNFDENNGSLNGVSLREAILASNATAAADTINFNIAPGGLQTIAPNSPLPTLTSKVTIAGDSQLFTQIQLSGINAGAGTNGLVMKAAGCVVRSLIVNRFQGNGILALGSSGVVEGCHIGTNFDGTSALGNQAHGVLIAGTATGVRIGGTTAAAGNIISGNTLSGVAILGTLTKSNLVQGNIIGTDAAGTFDLGNGFDGVLIAEGAKSNLIGGAVAGARNLISGNNSDGVKISGSGTTGNLVQGNFIGTDAAGTFLRPNSFAGVKISLGAAGNTVGGTAPGARNVISGNNANGIEISDAGTTGNLVQGNFIGTDVAGDFPRPNSFAGVVISGGAANNTVGGIVAGARNVISGNNTNGVEIGFIGNLTISFGNLVQGNFIGTNAAGTASLGNIIDGVLISSAPNNTVGGIVAAARNVISGNTGDGVEIRGALASGNRVQGNFLGTNAAGTLSLGNGNVGVRINGAPNNTVGGTVAGARNVLSGNNDSGVVIEGAVAGGNLVQGNFIGVNPAGTADMGNAFDGVQIRGAAVNNTVGGTVAAARNIISGNNQFGVFVRNADTVSNRIQGNFIGLAANGVAPMGNTSHGIWIADAANNNTIAAAAAGAGHVIAHNGGAGVLIGNDPAFLGLTTAGSENSVLGNRIFSNAGQGIDLGNNDGPTPNDVNDADSGPNDLLNNPVLTSAFLDGANLQITGFINTNQFRVLRIEFFASPVSGQGQTFLGFHTVNVGQNNSIAFAKMLVVPPSVLVGHKLTATITDQFGSTSEFSLPVTIE